MNHILTLRKDSFLLSIPFFGLNIILNLEKYQPYSDKVLTRVKTRIGDKDIMITPQLLSYKLMYDGNSIGILNFVNNQINATFLIDNKQYEIRKYKNQYVIFDVNNSINQSNFSCNVKQKINSISNVIPNIAVSAPLSTPVCIETAIEIDNYTRNTFATNQEALDWALANISGVSQLYQAQTNAEIQVVHVTIWDIVDPYDTCSSTGSVLTQIRDNWMSNNSAINRDHVHFLSKRGLNGGVTYGSGLCEINWHYAVSTALGTDTNFTFPNPVYSWNLNLIAHELGHNIGSAHTHWCGWSADTTYGFIGGGIDDCAVSAGYANACSPPAPSPDSAGTIMSYCHLSVQAIILEFHDIVVIQALIPGLLNASCVTMCNSDGCTDSTALNYNASALTDDGSCIYLVNGCTDPNASNFDSTANTDDSSCTYPGCTDSLATNFDPMANLSDSSCTYSCIYNGYDDAVNTTVFIDLFATEGSWELFDANGDTVVFVAAGSMTTSATYTTETCLMDGCYQLFFHDLWGDGWVDFNGTAGWIMTQDYNGDTLSFNMVSGNGGSSIISVGGVTCIFGCSDSLACNYDYLSDIDDSSCIYDIINQQDFLICDEDSIIVGSSVYNMTGNYIDTLAISSGCDSIIYTNLLVNNNSYFFDSLVVFTNIIWNGIPLSVSGDYSVTLINSVGCDSIVNLNLKITNSTSIEESTNNKKLMSITNVLGQKTSFRKNTSLFYIYDDGTVEKRIILE